MEETLVQGDYEGDALQSDKESDPEHLLDKFFQGPFGGKTLVTFDGWRTVYPGRFGHVGAHDHQILVDRFIKAEPAPVPSDADYARWRRILNQH